MPPSEGDLTIFGVLSKIAGAFALLALIKLAISSKGTKAPKGFEPELAQPGLAPQAPVTTAAPL